MKVKSLIVGIGFISLTTLAFAQSVFEGFYGQVGIGYENSTPSYSGGTLNNSAYSYSLSGGTTNSFAATATIGYYFPVTGNFLLGIGAEYSPLSGTSTNATVTIPALKYSESQSIQKKIPIISLFLLLTLLIKRSLLTLRWVTPMLIMKLVEITTPITAIP